MHLHLSVSFISVHGHLNASFSSVVGERRQKMKTQLLPHQVTPDECDPKFLLLRSDLSLTGDTKDSG